MNWGKRPSSFIVQEMSETGLWPRARFWSRPLEQLRQPALMSMAPLDSGGRASTCGLSLHLGPTLVSKGTSCCHSSYANVNGLHSDLGPWWQLGPGCCLGPYLGMWSYHSQGLDWCPWSILPLKTTKLQGSGAQSVVVRASEGHAATRDNLIWVSCTVARDMVLPLSWDCWS